MRGSFTSEAAAEPPVSPAATTTGSAGRGPPTRSTAGSSRGLPDLRRRGHDPLLGRAAEQRPLPSGVRLSQPTGSDELHRPAVTTPKAGTSYGMGWFVGPTQRNPGRPPSGRDVQLPLRTSVLVSRGRTGVIVLMNAENSLDLFTTGRMGTIAAGVASLLEGQEPPPPPSNSRSSSSLRAVRACSCSSSGIVRRSPPATRRTFRRWPDSLRAWRIGSRSASLVWALRPGARAEAARLAALSSPLRVCRISHTPSAQRTRCSLLGDCQNDLGVRDAPSGSGREVAAHAATTTRSSPSESSHEHPPPHALQHPLQADSRVR